MISDFTQIDTALAAQLVQQYWGLEVECSSLPSYADKNFRLSQAQSEFVLKFANPGWDYADLDFENQALLHLQRKKMHLTLPEVKLSRQGQHLIPLAIASAEASKLSYFRLLSFVPGHTYASLARYLQDQHDHAALTNLEASLGQALALLALGLSDFQHSRSSREQDWNLLNLPNLSKHLALIADEVVRARVAQVLDEFEQSLLPQLNRLPKQVLHNDANDLNVIVADGRVTAIIDFGDMCSSVRIADLAIAITYALQFSADVSLSVLTITAAYHRVYPLTATELKLLWPCILARLCQSILLASQAAQQQPQNDFAQVSQAAVRTMLLRFIELDRIAITTHLLHILL